MQQINNLRDYYNHAIYPELVRTEKKRHSLLLALGGCFLGIWVILFVQLYVDILSFTLLAVLILVYYINHFYTKWEEFKISYKAHIVNLLFDFITNHTHFRGSLEYFEQGMIDIKTFTDSRLFEASENTYQGEDYIKGQHGNLEFEMSELLVQAFSPVRNKLTNTFKGVFLHARYNPALDNADGEIIVLPREQRAVFSNIIKDFTGRGGRHFDKLSLDFMQMFITYATPQANMKQFLSAEMQEAILRYCHHKHKNIFISFIGNDIYVAVQQEKNILEPTFTQTNLSFERITEYYTDITMLLNIVLDIDQNT